MFRADNIQTPFLKLSIAKQRDLNGDGRETIAGCGPALPHPPTPYHRSHLVVQLFFLFFSLSLRYRACFLSSLSAPPFLLFVRVLSPSLPARSRNFSLFRVSTLSLYSLSRRLQRPSCTLVERNNPSWHRRWSRQNVYPRTKRKRNPFCFSI